MSYSADTLIGILHIYLFLRDDQVVILGTFLTNFLLEQSIFPFFPRQALYPITVSVAATETFKFEYRIASP